MLTGLEFQLLYYIARRPRRILTRKLLIQVLWDAEWYGMDHTLHSLVARLRKAIGDTRHQIILTRRGLGYAGSQELLVLGCKLED